MESNRLRNTAASRETAVGYVRLLQPFVRWVILYCNCTVGGEPSPCVVYRGRGSVYTGNIGTSLYESGTECSIPLHNIPPSTLFFLALHGCRLFFCLSLFRLSFLTFFFLSYFRIFFPYLFVIYNSSKAHDTHHIGMLIILCDFVCVVCMYLCCTCSAGKGLREL